MKKTRTTLFIILLTSIFTGFISCSRNLKIVTPIFIKDVNETIQEIGATGSFSNVTFSYSTKLTNYQKPSHELELKLFNGKNLPENESGLDSLARNLATIFKHSIQNINAFDWIFVIFDSDDGRSVDLSKKNVFVYRPIQLK